MISRLRSIAWRGHRHRLGQVSVDVVLIGLAWWFAFVVRFDGDPPGRYDRLFVVTVGVVLVIKLVTFVVFRFYTRWWRFTGIADLEQIVAACLVATALVLTALTLWRPDGFEPVPRGVFALDFLFTVVLIGGVRFVVRSVMERSSRGGGSATGRPVIICGAGSAANSLLGDMRRESGLAYTPVGLIDDDPRKAGLRVGGVKVLGTREDLSRVLRDTRAREVIIAMPSAPGAVRRDIVDRCRTAGVRVTTLPGLPELMNGDVSVQKLREVRVEDVLGRASVEIDMARVARYLNGRRVLVTGAGGSIGSELCRQLVAVGPSALVILDHAENNLFEIDLELRDRGHSPVPVIADCRDEELMDRVFTQYRPEIVFHAAAYKHVPMMEINPIQAIANNSLATATLANLATRHGVDRVCLISTDKAVEPQTVMGGSKALAERIIEMHAHDAATRFAAVRFGNVLGSSGSVLPIFRRQIATGGPVTVTHPDMARYFMTIPEAVQLVIEATGIADGGDVFVLDMGEPVRIMDLAENMIRLSGMEPGRDIQIEITGVRPGEKLHEELFNLDEQVRPTRYGGILRATRPPLDPDALGTRIAHLRSVVADGDPVAASAALWATLRAGRDGGRVGEYDDVHVRDERDIP
ncbi:MAG: polysaccharide biosynthesis protein [Thermoleophilia bacterium]|nr:polysaccharide biosynthesis protein [Thermoleophilia bacterium]